MRVAVIRAGALGDGIVTFPVLAALRSRATVLRFVGPGRVVALARRAGLCDEGLDLESAGALWLFGGAAPPGGFTPGAWDLDLVVTFVDGLDLPLRRAGVRRVIVGDPRGPVLPIHRQLLGALEPLGLAEAPHPLPPPAFARFEGGGPVVLAPGSGGRAKRWPLSAWARVDAALRGLGHDVRWVAGPVEAEEVATWPVDPCRVFRTDLDATADLAARARAWVGVDSGTSHLAAWVGCPTIVLFGPTDPARWGPPGATILGLSDPPGTVVEAVSARAR